jgi:outer membrane receptor protein involved in Fe transport
MIGGAALASLVSASAHAQDAAPAATGVQEVVITGSRIRQPNLTSTSPVTSISAQEIQFEGAQRTEDLLNRLPQVFASQASTVSNGSNGTATVDLRGLGANRTLVLVDGRRLVPGDPENPVADINMIPAAMIERIDVLTGGASATYGADAVAGVVNFILKKNFEGVEIDANHSFYDHDNGNSYLEGILKADQAANPAQFQNPKSNYVGGGSTDINIVVGASSPDGKGNATAYMGYRQTEPILESNYDYSACTLAHQGAGVRCGGSGTTAPTHFYPNNGNSQDLIIDSKTGLLRNYNSGTDAFNYGPYNYYQRNDTRYTGGYSAHYQVNEHADVYSQFMFMSDSTTAQIAPSGVFTAQVNLSCNNPMLTQDEVTQLCNHNFANYNPATNSVLTYIAHRNVEGGPRQDNEHHDQFRFVVGSRGDLDKTWSYDVYGEYGQTDYSENYQNDMSVTRQQNALNVISVNGVLECASAAARSQGCVPYNIFQLGGVTQAALNYIDTPGYKSGFTTEQVVSGAVTGKLGNYGVKSPWANDGVSLVIGAEYRREGLHLGVDSEYSTGDLAGQGGATNGSDGAYDVKEFFLETRMPIVSDKPFIKDLSLDGAYRRSDYSSVGTTDTFKLEANWTPIRDIRFRGGYNRAVRAPSILELYSTQSVALDGTTDPCAGALNTISQAQQAACLKYDPYFKANPSRLGQVAANSANQYNGLTGGNPNLAPEKADTVTIGTVVTPRFLPGFDLTVDYYSISITGEIGGIGADNILADCYSTGEYCNLIHRAANGSLWLSPSGYVIDTNQNIGSVTTRGVDFIANYRLGLEKVGLKHFGSLAFNLVGTDTLNFGNSSAAAAAGSGGCVGLFGPSCGIPHPAWKSNFRVTWYTPWKIDASVQWRYIGGVRLDSGATGLIDSTIPAYNYFDLTAAYKLTPKITLRAGVNNLFDKDPPIIPGDLSTAQNNGNTAPGVYDALGRYIFTSLVAKF